MGIAQLVEHLVVVQGAAGSSPVTHPRKQKRTREVIAGFLLSSGPCVGAKPIYLEIHQFQLHKNNRTFNDSLGFAD